MVIKDIILFTFVFGLIIHISHGQQELNDPDPSEDPLEDTRVTRDDFPKDFYFGTSSSAYQFEGAAYLDGKGPSIWDVFTANHSDKIKDNSSGLIAEDFFHRYKEDLPMMNYLGFNAFRFSISWPRILPYGKISRGLNYRGIAYYNSLIDEMIKNGQEPFATIFHWDLPQALEQEYKGFLDKQIVDDFRDYAELCFSLFGDRVKNWITINEPWSYSVMGYAYGSFPPNRCSNGTNKLPRGFFSGRFASYSATAECEHGDSGTEPYIVSHHLLLSHAAAVEVYRKHYQKYQNGEIGITLCTQWYKPQNKTYKKDQYAKDRAIAFMYGWFMEPIATGTYPEQMITHVGDRLPKFSKNDSERVKGSADFIGLNYYTANFVADINPCPTDKTYMSDRCANETTESADGTPIGHKTYLDWLNVYPEGIRDILMYGKRMYKNPPMYVTENGVDRRNMGNRLHDLIRKRYHKNHMKFLPELIKNENIMIKGYFVWSYMDNFEWLDGYTVNFGLVYVDHNNTLNRFCKDSALWYKNFLQSNQTKHNTTYSNCNLLFN